MQRHLASLILKIGLPVLSGQFASDWLSSALRPALAHLPVRAIFLFAVLLVWAAFREYRESKKQTFR
ncbi:MAG: hypothetical protein ABI471_07420 [Sphingomonas bacterium]